MKKRNEPRWVSYMSEYHVEMLVFMLSINRGREEFREIKIIGDKKKSLFRKVMTETIKLTLGAVGAFRDFGR